MHHGNRGKYDELVDDFASAGVELIFKPDLVLSENSEVLKENAYMKALQAAQQTGLPALGDDSGIFIEALDFFPGVHSRRWTGSDEDDECRNNKIIAMMSTETNRTVYLISRFAIVNPEGRMLGESKTSNKFNIAYTSRGDNGFGYDRILEVRTDNWDERKDPSLYGDALMYTRSFGYAPTVAELDQWHKNALNQRGKCIAIELAEVLNDE